MMNFNFGNLLPNCNLASAAPTASNTMKDVHSNGLTERRRFNCSSLPSGWSREEVPRKGGASAGKTDVYYYSPSGIKVRSKPELIKLLGDQFDLSMFDFKSGKVNAGLIQKPAAKKKKPEQQSVPAKSTEASLVPPIRQTASIFKQPVTLFKTHDATVKSGLKNVAGKDKPCQLLWQKRFAGISANCREEDDTAKTTMTLPESIKSVGLGVDGSILLTSISTALHMATEPVYGQNGNQEIIEKDPGVFLDPAQPLMAKVTVSEDDINKQEEKVKQARQRLADAMQALG